LDGHGAFQIIGSTFVLASTLGITFSDWFEAKNFCPPKVEAFNHVESFKEDEKLPQF